MSGADNLRASVEKLRKQLLALAKAAPEIARSAVSAGLSTQSRAVKAASPGTVKKEVGWFVRQSGSRAWGRVGLMQYPDRQDKGEKPHGVFLTAGTKYIKARHFIEQSLRNSAGAAARAMNRRAASKINQVISRNQ